MISKTQKEKETKEYATSILEMVPNVKDILISYNEGSKQPMRMFFRCDEDSMFFLTRCVDRNYWGHGHQWQLVSVISDQPDRKIGYMLESCHSWSGVTECDVAATHLDSLEENIIGHLSHKNFLKSFLPNWHKRLFPAESEL